ncbi:uncharacterized protein LOC142492104 [Ascaphus truei]|uniref:uncharacterized protein LOC142492104 n=1 Tax=Ascaphus truei TaxID=8439 RepID=UPI003F59D857
MGRTSSAVKKEMWDQIQLSVSACGNHVRDRTNCRKRFDDIKATLKKKIQAQRMHASGTGGGLPSAALMLTPLEEQLRDKFLPVVVEGLPGDRDIGIYPEQFPPVAPQAPVSPVAPLPYHMSSPATSMSSSRMEEQDISAQGQMDSSEHELVDTPGLNQHSSRPARDTFAEIAASEQRILDEDNRRHSEIMSLHERMNEKMISEMTQIKNVIIQIPKELQNLNNTLQALVLNVSQATQLMSTAREHQFHFNPSEDGSLHGASFSPDPSVLH